MKAGVEYGVEWTTAAPDIRKKCQIMNRNVGNYENEAKRLTEGYTSH
jgi:hypothetical protein